MPVSRETIAFAHRLADVSGEVIRPYFRARIEVVGKPVTINGRAVFDPVTEADKGAERAIRAVIEAERPQDGILGEEYGERVGTSGLRWVLDPVDGTRSFINGRHEWGTLISLEDNGTPVLGIIDQPWLGERFIAVNGTAELHEKGKVLPLRVRACEKLSDALLCATTPDAFQRHPGMWERFQRVEKEVKLTRWGGDCYLYATMALGFCDLIIESLTQRWDVAALMPVIEAAGGIITDWQGNVPGNGGVMVAAGDKRVHEAALKLLNA
jgi:histidinol phosphatase-like enzyme (inositol monophosphatase family)